MAWAETHYREVFGTPTSLEEVAQEQEARRDAGLPWIPPAQLVDPLAHRLLPQLCVDVFGEPAGSSAREVLADLRRRHERMMATLHGSLARMETSRPVSPGREGDQPMVSAGDGSPPSPPSTTLAADDCTQAPDSPRPRAPLSPPGGGVSAAAARPRAAELQAPGSRSPAQPGKRGTPDPPCSGMAASPAKQLRRAPPRRARAQPSPGEFTLLTRAAPRAADPPDAALAAQPGLP